MREDWRTNLKSGSLKVRGLAYLQVKSIGCLETQGKVSGDRKRGNPCSARVSELHGSRDSCSENGNINMI